MAEDIIRTFGYLTLGSRFRRIGERLQADTQQIIDRSGVSIQAGQCPMLAAIGRHETMTIGELAEAVGISQPGVTRTVSQLVAQGLIEMRASDEDQRRKLVSLTAAGKDFVEFAHRQIWPKIEAAVRDLCGDLSGPLLNQLDSIEDGLAMTSLLRRTKEKQEDPMSHILDRPAWNSLHNAHAALAEGGDLAMRYPPTIVPFAAVADNTAESLKALTALAKPDEVLTFVEAGPVVIPDAFTVTFEGILVQMVADQPHPAITDPRIEKLGEADAEEMLALAMLTKPGPFTLGAQKLGPFWGIRIDGKLVAMAGQRLRVPRFTELSGLCTHPDFQGRGFGALLFRFVAGEIAARGETAFLHAFAGNTTAISLYKKLGFSIREEMNLRVIKRQG